MSARPPDPEANRQPLHEPETVGAREGCTLIRHASLLGRNTLRVDAHAAWVADIEDVDAIPGLLAGHRAKDDPPLLLGGGSNVLFVRDYAGTIITLKTRGVEELEGDHDAVRLRVAAGERWDDLVRWTLAEGHPGLENLILIPGSVGAAPMQNIGAYGVEVSEFIEAVEAYDLGGPRPVSFIREQCAFDYRDSIFKRHPDRWLITAITLRLPRKWEPRLEYAGLRDEIGKARVARPAPIHVAEAVIALRTRKLPDPAVIGNAGSFFKNPIVTAAQAEALRAAHPTLPCWPAAGGSWKFSAAWMIESCGFKGLREGDAGISNRHALVLVNHGHATGAQLWSLAQRVREGVQVRFGIPLEPEPRVIGA